MTLPCDRDPADRPANARMYSWLHEVPLERAEVVTANNRLARELRSAHDHGQIAAGLRAWRTPVILPWSAWLRTIAQGGALSARSPLCLAPAASAAVWERLLREIAGERLLNVAGLVRQMQQAWQRLQDWCVPTADLSAAAGSDDQRLFAGIAVAYEKELAQNGWMDVAQLPALASDLVAHGRVTVPALLVHAGFDRPHPAMKKLLAAMAAAGCELRRAPAADRRRSLELVAAADADAEMRAAGAWARARLAANPSARVGVVRVSLEADAARAARVLRDGLAPGWQYGDRSRLSAVNVSYGGRLSDYPMLAVALLWLKWVQRGLTSTEVSVLLRSPFTPLASLSGRHRMERRLRGLPDREWPAATLAEALMQPDDEPAADWKLRLQAVVTLSRHAAEVMAPAAWTSRIDDFLTRLGWPGNRTPDSAEFQLLNRWRELLNELSLLEPVRPRLRFGEVLARLAALAADTVFQPQSAEGMVQLLGPLEAAGLEFDCVWVANLQAVVWPPAPRPLRLVARSLQQQAGLPDASPADTLDHARRILDRIAGSAASVVMSWPLAEGDMALVPSPVLEEFRVYRPRPAHDPGWFATQLSGRLAVSRQAHDPVPGIRPGEKVSGGAYTVQHQFDEPFSAFAHGRLHVRKLPKIEPGLSARMRGKILHHALADLLRDRPSLSALRQWTPGVAEQRIERAVASAVQAPSRYADEVLQRLLALERSRLQGLLQAFLECEKLRPAFVVEAVERSIRFRRHGVTLDLRMDRGDRLADGSLLIVDYKTGARKSLLTGSGTPKEWQLVLYACALEDRIGGLLLLNVDSRGIVYRGTGGNVPWYPLGDAEWRVLLDGWIDRVDEEVARIAGGDVRIDVARTVQESRLLNILSRAEELKRAG